MSSTLWPKNYLTAEDLAIDAKRCYMVLTTMAHVLVFPNQHSFDLAFQVVGTVNFGLAALEPPEFCRGLAPPSIVVSGGAKGFWDELQARRIPVSGMVAYQVFGKEVPEAPPPDGRWREILGDLTITTVRPSLTDPLKLRIEIALSKNLGSIIPIMARLIRGGAYRSEGPILAFEEEHRLICMSPDRLVFSRIDDLLDMWIMLRCTVDLVVAAWERRLSLKPDSGSRQGVGAIEIFKRLPATNCQRCNNPNCMEFATGLLTGRCTVDQCAPLMEAQPQYLESLLWLMRAIGLNAYKQEGQ
jgi:ArsR family metal-binding transcriptional regulator